MRTEEVSSWTRCVVIHLIPRVISKTRLSPDDISTHKSEAEVQLNSLSREDSEGRPRRDARFWLVFLAICITLFLSALDFTAVSTALPTIVHDLNGEDFVWVASAYALAATALLPMSGAMAQVFGRRVTILGAIGLFALGSVLCGTAKNMNWLIAARTIEGAGGGAIQSITSIIVSDLVSLRERAMYNALIGLTWAVAAALGPIVGGALAQEGQWRWLFYLNLPICGAAAVLVLLFLNLKTPRGSFGEKIMRLDWIGNFLVVASSTSVVIALTWGGVKYSWSSAYVLVPLILGLVGLGLFLVYEALVAKNPLVPFTLISNRTSLSGYLQTFIVPIVLVAAVYFLPVYWQACKGASPVRSGVELFGLAMSVGPFLIIAAATVTLSKKYRVQLWFAWICYIVAMGGLSTLKADSPLSISIGLPIILGVGAGINLAVTYFPVLAPLPVSENAHALAFFSFCRSFASVWAFSVGIAILQTQLVGRLPAEFVQQFPEGVAIAYSVIPSISSLEEPLRTTVREAYAESLKAVWQVMIGIAGFGFLASLMMKGMPLHTQVDEQWGMEQEDKDKGNQVRLSETRPHA